MKLIIAGGGTGGHLFPGVAIAEELLRQQPQSEVLFICTSKEIDKKILGKAGFPFFPLELTPLGGSGFYHTLKGLMYMIKAVATAHGQISRFAPEAVLGMGGGSSIPAVLAAVLKRVPIFLQEQNIIMGKANRLIARFSRKIFLAYGQAGQAMAPRLMCLVTGNPVRPTISQAYGSAKTLGLRDGVFTLFTLGGSQGAQRLNTAMRKAVLHLKNQGINFQLIHQTGQAQHQEAADFYHEEGIIAYTTPFIDKIGEAYALADLVVARAGATSIAELTYLGKPMVLVPYPFAADDHQTLNAKMLAEKGAALWIKDDERLSQNLIRTLEKLISNRPLLKKMGKASSQLGTHGAASKIVSEILAAAGF